MKLQIRQEIPSDYEQVERIITQAFNTAPHSDGNEARLVHDIRIGKNFIPQLSLVALYEDEIIGHILFSKIKIGNGDGLALAPLSVLPEFQRMGVGKSLISAGHQIASKMGFTISVVLGDPAYYMKNGFSPAFKYGIYPPFNTDSKYYMVHPLIDGELPDGIVVYDMAFGLW